MTLFFISSVLILSMSNICGAFLIPISTCRWGPKHVLITTYSSNWVTYDVAVILSLSRTFNERKDKLFSLRHSEDESHLTTWKRKNGTIDEDKPHTRREKKNGATDTSNATKVHGRTRAQIKKMKHLMVRDVEELLLNHDASSAMEKATDNIRRLNKLYEIHGNKYYKPTTLLYNVLLRSCAKLERDDAPDLAEKVLKEMQLIERMQMEERIRHDAHSTTLNEEDQDELSNGIKPNSISYSALIEAYARSQRQQAAEKAEEILIQMMQLAEERGDDGSLPDSIAPTSVTCDIVLNAWAKRGTRQAAERAESILERMEYLRTKGHVRVQPTTYSFCTVITAWARSNIPGGEAAERAEYILHRLIDFHRMLSSKESSKEYASHVVPDRVVFNAAIAAWAASSEPQAGTRAEQLFDQMISLKIEPDTITFNALINSHAASGHMNAAKAAENVLIRMEEAAKRSPLVRPDTKTYNQVLKAYAVSRLPDAANRADQILSYMLQCSTDKDNIKSNITTFVKPDVVSFSTCLDVWAKSSEYGKAGRAYSILQKMNEYYLVSGNDDICPNTITYNTCLNACAFSAFGSEEEQKQALALAVKLFNELCSKRDMYLRPDSITYGTLLKAFANLAPKGNKREAMALLLFRKSCEQGFVNELVWNEAKRMISSVTLTDLLKQSSGISSSAYRSSRRVVDDISPLVDLKVSDLPTDWTRSVVESKKKHRRRLKDELVVPRINDELTKRRNEDLKSVRPIRNMSELLWQSSRDL